MYRCLSIGLVGMLACAVLLVGCGKENQPFSSEMVSSSIDKSSSLKRVERGGATRLDLNVYNVKIQLEKTQYKIEDIKNNQPIVFTVTNNWEKDIDLAFIETQHFELEVQIDGKWYSLPPSKNGLMIQDFAPIGSLEIGESMEHTLQWHYYDYDFSPGHYRVAWISPKSWWSTGEFDIIE